MIEHPTHGSCIRYCPLELGLGEQPPSSENLESFAQSLEAHVDILRATIKHKARFMHLVERSEVLRLVPLPEWAGMGGVRFVPEGWESLLTDQAKTELNKLNIDLVEALKSTDNAFSLGEGTDGLICVRFGMVTHETEVEELLDLVVTVGKSVQENSRVLDTMSEIVKKVRSSHRTSLGYVNFIHLNAGHRGGHGGFAARVRGEALAGGHSAARAGRGSRLQLVVAAGQGVGHQGTQPQPDPGRCREHREHLQVSYDHVNATHTYTHTLAFPSQISHANVGRGSASAAGQSVAAHAHDTDACGVHGRAARFSHRGAGDNGCERNVPISDCCSSSGCGCGCWCGRGNGSRCHNSAHIGNGLSGSSRSSDRQPRGPRAHCQPEQRRIVVRAGAGGCD